MLRYKFAGSCLRSLVLGHFDGTPTGMSLDAARAEVRKLRELASRGIDPAKARPRRNTKTAAPVPLSAADAMHSVEYLVADFMERYVRAHYDQPEQVEGMLNRDVLPEWKGRDARTITPREVHHLLDKIVSRGSKVMANRVADAHEAVQMGYPPANC